MKWILISRSTGKRWLMIVGIMSIIIQAILFVVIAGILFRMFINSQPLKQLFSSTQTSATSKVHEKIEERREYAEQAQDIQKEKTECLEAIATHREQSRADYEEK